MEAVLPDGNRLNNWSVSNFIGLHNNADMKVHKLCSISIFTPITFSRYFRLKALRSSKVMVLEHAGLQDFMVQLIFI